MQSNSEHESSALDLALELTFPASDPIAVSVPRRVSPNRLQASGQHQPFIQEVHHEH